MISGFARAQRVASSVLIVLLVNVLGANSWSGHAQTPAASSWLAQVRFIVSGLSVAPPHQKRLAGKVKMSLFAAYLLETKQKQRASIRFQDKTTLHLNQRTDVILRSPHLTYVQNGEVDEALQPGTSHRVQTAAAVASAIGTNFDVKVVHGGTVFVVMHGSIRVKNKKGTVTVKQGQQSVVLTNQAPQPPIPADASKTIAWTNGLPTPVLPENVAIDAAGGKVVDFSSQYSSAVEGHFWNAAFLIDGRLDSGWESGSGNITNQSVTVRLAGGKLYRISQVIIDPAATHMDPPAADLKDFEIQVSTTGTATTDFTTVLAKTCQQQDSLQRFTLDTPVNAKYVRLVALNNYGSPDWIGVAELEVIGLPA